MSQPAAALPTVANVLAASDGMVPPVEPPEEPPPPPGVAIAVSLVATPRSEAPAPPPESLPPPAPVPPPDSMPPPPSTPPASVREAPPAPSPAKPPDEDSGDRWAKLYTDPSAPKGKADDSSIGGTSASLQRLAELADGSSSRVRKRHEDPKRQAVEKSGEFCSVRKHSSMGCAVVSFSCPEIRTAVLAEAGDIAEIRGIKVQLQAHKDKGKEVVTDIFAAWGRKVEKASPLSEGSLMAFFESLRDAVEGSIARRGSAAEQGAPDDQGCAAHVDGTEEGKVEEVSAPTEEQSRAELPAAAPAEQRGGVTDDFFEDEHVATTEQEGTPANDAPSPAMIGETACEASAARVGEPKAPKEAEAADEVSLQVRTAVKNYIAEGDGYLAVVTGDVVEMYKGVEAPAPADDCAFPIYGFGLLRHRQRYTEAGIASSVGDSGWVPMQVVWERYVDGTGAPWLYDPLTGDWEYEANL